MKKKQIFISSITVLFTILSAFIIHINLVHAEGESDNLTNYTGNCIDDLQGKKIAEEITEYFEMPDDKEHYRECDKTTTCETTPAAPPATAKTECNTLYEKAGTCKPSSTVYCQTVYLILGSSGTDMLKAYIKTIYMWASGLVGLIAVLVIVISGIEITYSSGNSDAAKTRIMQSLAGLVILFLSALLLYTINPTFFTK